MVNELKKENSEIKEELTNLKIGTENKIYEIDQRNAVKDLENRMALLEKNLTDNNETKEKEVNEIWEELLTVNDKINKQNTIIQKVAWNTDKNEQYTRRENLRMFGIPEGEDEDTMQVVIDVAQKIGVKLSRSDISVSHRIGATPDKTRRNAAPRPLIARFVRRETKDILLKQRHKLPRKDTRELREGEFNIYINDDLTQLKTTMRKELHTHPDTIKVGTVNGKLLYTYTDKRAETPVNRTVTIDSPIDLIKKLNWNIDKLHSLGMCVEDERLESDGEITVEK